ncbi:unnamed protein product [Symbiodinium sp. CCMP2456]|nr:unnamed protein product [Symbiodinium sp. CCMP2456]
MAIRIMIVPTSMQERQADKVNNSVLCIRINCFEHGSALQLLRPQFSPPQSSPPQQRLTGEAAPSPKPGTQFLSPPKIEAANKASTSGQTDEERRVLEVGAHPEFANVVLLTAANYAYFAIYQNWRCNAERHGLDWAVVANDEEAFQQLGADRALLAIGEKVSGMNGWGSAKLDSVGRNKMFMVLTIMRVSGLGVVFTDADNMFRGDPFATGVHLGDLIRSEKYDYVYQEELAKAPDKGHIVDRQREESYRKHGERLGADQPIFWQVVQLLRSTGGKVGPGGFKCVKLCQQSPTCQAPLEDTLQYCSMNAFMHPTGWEEPPPERVTYHANYAANNDKIAKLEKAGLWGAWSEKAGRCQSFNLPAGIFAFATPVFS